MTGIIFGGRVRAMVAPAGTRLDDPDGDWRDLGILGDGIGFASGGVVEAAPRESWKLPGDVTFTIPFQVIRCSWNAHRWMYGRPHPGQRRAKTRYQARARRRTRRGRR
ncbi:hypothetical protein [Nonomuraea sp. NPDC050202]|uniref:hypothetical protein n=1 Tax=Nonomuraea sp. NPDC050202 TaxID=3155035 RepID=UPI0033DDAC2F